MFAFLRTRQWVVARRILLVSIVVAVAIKTYGPAVRSRLSRPDPRNDIVITRSEFHSDVPGTRPAWIIGLRNGSRRFTYNRVHLEATYTDDGGAVLGTDSLFFRRKLVPGDEQVVGGPDPKDRPGVTRGTLRVVDAEVGP